MSASIAEKARLGRNVRVGDYTVIHENVEIGDDVSIDTHCIIGYPSARSEGKPLRIGAGSLIRSHSVFYEGSEFGPGLRTGHHVSVRERTIAGRDLQIGTYSDLQGDLVIGEHCRTHSGVFLAPGCRIGSFVWILPHVVLTNDPRPPSDVWLGVTVEDFAIIAAMACILPGVRVGTRSLVGAGSVVTRDVPADHVVAGNPARVMCRTSELKMTDRPHEAAYPWMHRFHRGYPREIVESWLRSDERP
ncbi:MAG: N-acetyltransferase [Burkholderiales bacterium]